MEAVGGDGGVRSLGLGEQLGHAQDGLRRLAGHLVRARVRVGMRGRVRVGVRVRVGARGLG